MHPGPDSMGAPAGFASRRPNAPSLPTFELPPPPQQKYASYAVSASQSSQTPGSLASVGNLLTPPSTIGGDGISPTSGIPTSSASSGPPSYTPNGSYAWSPPTQSSAYSFPQQGGHQHRPYQHQQQHHQQQQHQQQQHVQQQHPQRATYSPLHTGNRVSQPPSSEGQMSTSSYEVSLPSFPSSMPMSAPPSLATMAPPHHQQQSQHGNMMGAQTPVSSSGQHPSPVHAQESFRPPNTPQYYSQQPPNTPQHSHYPYSTGPPPAHSTPLSAGGAMGGRPQMSPASAGPAPLSAPPVQGGHYGQRPPFSSTYQPQHNSHGPVLSNLNNPGGPPMLMGGLPQGLVGFNSGHAASLQHMYNNNPHQTQQPPHNDRPFKCDQCPQSFNRNHDLKRHKRIHLAVKPFPCGHCDKSFSRKDALKRHILVKGCGKNKEAADGDKQEGSQSPNAKSETHDVKPIVSS